MTKRKAPEELTDKGIGRRLFPKEVTDEFKRVAKEPQPVEKQRDKRRKKN